jgi:hypothetical protein
MKQFDSQTSILVTVLSLLIGLVIGQDSIHRMQIVNASVARPGNVTRLPGDANAPAAPCGAPSFALPTPLLPTRSLSHFVAEDFNRDGRTDLVTLSFSDRMPLGFVPGNAAGAFDSPIVTPLDIRSVYRFVLNAADFNNDRNPDLAILDGGAQALYVLLGNGRGGFAAPVSYKASPQGDTMLIADFNRDGNPDVVAGSDFTAQYAVLLGTGMGGFRDETLFTVQGIFDAAIALGAGDFNGDNQLDLVYLGRQFPDLSNNPNLLRPLLARRRRFQQ